MFTLIDDPVTKIKIGGVVYKLNMSFDNIIRINELQNDESLTDEQQLIQGARLLFVKPPSMSLQHLCRAFITAYTEVVGTAKDDDVTYDLLGNPMPTVASEDEDESGPIHDLMQDAEYIYSSFMKDYGIDLHKERGRMHWHVFKSLLSGLSDETMFKKVLRIRQEPLPKDSKARSEMEKLKKHYALKPRGKAVQHEGSTMQ